jgi:signal transduction histidine kinase
VATEHGLEVARQNHSDATAQRSILAAAGGLAGSIVLIVLFAGYLTRAIVRPVRRAAAMAGRLAGGDLGARLAERGVGEIGVLERSFNSMAGSLADSREELAASRARIVTAADQARRRIERDLHDGIQQRLVSLALELRAAETTIPAGLTEFGTQLADVADGLAGVTDELRELSRGIHPAVLSEGGLRPALRALARRSAVAVELDVDVPARPPDQVEVAAYYVVSEALTNAAKHANASIVHIDVRTRDTCLHLSVRDDGVGGATLEKGSGLIGLADRVQALGGTVSIVSPIGEGTTVLVTLPAR